MKVPALLLALLATICLAAAAGCGGDDDGGGAGEPEPAQTQPEETAPAPGPGGRGDDPGATVQMLQDALADGDAGAACGLLTESAVRQAEEASIGGSCEDWAEELSGVFDDPALKEKLRNTEILDVKASADSATVEYQSPILDIPVEAELEQSDGTWKISKLAEGV